MQIQEKCALFGSVFGLRVCFSNISVIRLDVPTEFMKTNQKLVHNSFQIKAMVPRSASAPTLKILKINGETLLKSSNLMPGAVQNHENAINYIQTSFKFTPN